MTQRGRVGEFDEMLQLMGQLDECMDIMLKRVVTPSPQPSRWRRRVREGGDDDDERMR